MAFYQRREVKDVLAYLRLVVNPEDDLSFARVLNIPKRGIGNTTLERLIEHARREGTSLNSSLAGPRAGDGHEVVAGEVPYDAESVDRDAEAVRITAACTAVMESAIRASPPEWVWMHERWKRRPAPMTQASSMPNSRERSAR